MGSVGGHTSIFLGFRSGGSWAALGGNARRGGCPGGGLFCYRFALVCRHWVVKCKWV